MSSSEHLSLTQRVGYGAAIGSAALLVACSPSLSKKPLPAPSPRPTPGGVSCKLEQASPDYADSNLTPVAMAKLEQQYQTSPDIIGQGYLIQVQCPSSLTPDKIQRHASLSTTSFYGCVAITLAELKPGHAPAMPTTPGATVAYCLNIEPNTAMPTITTTI